MNLHYSSPGLLNYYSSNRKSWDELYPSEQAAFLTLDLNEQTTILDIGCACGGLGLALNKRFNCTAYTGIEIHAEAARVGANRVSHFGGRVLEGDVLQARKVLTSAEVLTSFDLVTSLSALDWNTDVLSNVLEAWSFVNPGGHLLMSLRLHSEKCLNDISVSYQSTTPGVTDFEEVAPYVVIAVSEAVTFAKWLKPKRVDLFGYAGRPANNAITPVQQVFFTVALLEKSSTFPIRTKFEVHSPKALKEQVVSLIDP